MKFKIKETVVRRVTNIQGKVLYEEKEYRIYRPVLFGLLKVYLKIQPDVFNKGKYYVQYVKFLEATIYARREDADFVLWQMKHGTDNFQRVVTP